MITCETAIIGCSILVMAASLFPENLLAHGDPPDDLLYSCAVDAGTLCEPIALDPAMSVRVERVVRSQDSPAPEPFPHFHEPAELIWFDCARGEVMTEAGVHPIVDGTLLFLPSMAIHDFRLQGGAASWVMVHLDPSVSVDDPNCALRSLLVPHCFQTRGGERARLAMAFEWLGALTARPDRSADALALTGLLLKELPRDAPVADITGAGLSLHRLRPALDLVAEAADRPVTLEAAAARCHLSPSYFSRAFSKQFGVGFADYARQYRLRAAARSLTIGGSRVSEIAYRSGFLNPSHFSSAFQKRFGVSPTEFRRRYRTRSQPLG